MDEKQRRLVYRYLIARVGLRKAELPPLAALDHQMKNEFQVLAACLHAVTEAWEFCFALTSELPRHNKCLGRIKNMLAVSEPLFTTRPELVFDKCSHVMN